MRLWRARRRHDHVDAVLRQDGDMWVLEYSRNNRPLADRTYREEYDARRDAAAKLGELQRAGWVDHW